MTKRKLKKLIRKADKLGRVAISQAIFKYWKLGERPEIQFPYNNL